MPASTPSAWRPTAPASTTTTTRRRPRRSWRPIAISALRQAIHCCRKGGTVSIPGVYGGFLDKVPLGAAFHKGLTMKMGQTHMMRYMAPLLDRIARGEIDPSFVITHRLRLEDAPGRLQDVPRQARRVHQGRDEAVRTSRRFYDFIVQYRGAVRERRRHRRRPPGLALPAAFRPISLGASGPWQQAASRAPSSAPATTVRWR